MAEADCRKKIELSALRHAVALLESGGKAGAVLPFGVAAIDAGLPAGGLALGALHELSSAGIAEEESEAATSFLAGILARLAPPRPVLWCLRRLDLYAPGLARHGLTPDRLILVRARNDQEIGWAMEEGLRNQALAAVVGELRGLSMPASRRLQLAAENSGVTGFALHRGAGVAEAAVSAAVTRWRIAALPGFPAANRSSIGRPRWRVELLRCRAGMPASWEMEACDATGHVSVSAELVDRAAAPAKRRAGG